MGVSDYIDLARLIHLIGLALGFGVSLYLEYNLLRYIHVPFSERMVRGVYRIHRIVGFAMMVLWVSGLALFVLKTNLDPAAITPKLLAKFVVVSALTLNAALIGSIILPVLARNIGRTAIEAPLIDRLKMAVVAAVSACSWIAALTLGVFTVMKTLDASTLMTLGANLYGFGLATAVALAAIAPLFRDAEAPGAIMPAE